MKNLIILISILISTQSFGQTSGGGSVDLKIFFEKEISIQNIDVYYIEDNGSRFENITYIKNDPDNTLNIKGYHHWWAAPSFPTIVFRYIQNDIHHFLYINPKSEKQNRIDGWKEEIHFHLKDLNEIAEMNNKKIYYTVTIANIKSEIYQSETEKRPKGLIKITN